MPSLRRYVLLFILLLLLALLVQWPAAAAGSWLERQSDGRWRLAAPRGTLWQGSGLLLMRTSRNSPWRSLMNLNWHIRTTELLRGRLSIDIEPEQGRLHLIMTPDEVRLESLETTLPASALAPLIPGPLGRYHWDGQLQARSPTFACNRGTPNCQGQIEIRWDHAAVAEVPGPPLGNYHLTLTGNGPRLNLAMDTLEGRLQLKAHGEITPPGRLQIQGEATAPTKAGDKNDEALNALLILLMRPQGGGRYLINYRENGTGSFAP